MNKDTLAWLAQLGSGYKTYIAAAGFVLLATYHGFEGHGDKVAECLTAALAVLGLRHAISYTQPQEPGA